MNLFTQYNLRRIYDAISGHTIFHTDKGAGIVVRHDIDHNIERALIGSKIEDGYNIKSAYFALNTSKYWNEDMSALVDMQSRGHEIGWHNDAISQWLQGKGEVRRYIEEPLEKLRGMGLNIIGTAAHGSHVSQERGLLNQYIWKNYKLVQGFPTPFHETFDLKEFGLEYESYYTDHDHYLTDSQRIFFGGWEQGCIIGRLKRIIERKQRAILLIHHQLWEI
jgi:uncharacterized protein Usg